MIGGFPIGVVDRMNKTVLRDEWRTCVDCSAGFTVTVREQVFFQQKNLPLPKRCPACRARRRAAGQTFHSRQQPESR
jgi:hypothetical protein